MEASAERRRAHGPRLALTMADVEARFGDFDRAVYWTAVAERELGRLPRHYRARVAQWQDGGPPSAPVSAGGPP